MLSINSSGSKQVIEISNVPWRRPLPIRASADQDIEWASRALLGGERFPPVELRLIELKDVRFRVGDGVDGVVTTADSVPIEETTYFNLPTIFDDSVDVEKRSGNRLDKVFIGFDSGWTNYFHWLCYALPKSVIASQLLLPEVEIVLPDYVERNESRLPPRRRLAFTSSVWRDSLAFFGLADRVRFLRSGLYTATKLYMLWTQSPSPTEFLHTNAFANVFNAVRKYLPNISDYNSEIYISRNLARDKRVDQESEKLLLKFFDSEGIRVVNMENLSFAEQMKLFNSSNIVIAPHGAGLVNVVFGTPRLKALELNRVIRGDEHLRPWFYMLCSKLNITYMYLDGTGRTYTLEEMKIAVERLRTADATQW